MWWGYSSALDLLDECSLNEEADCCGDGARGEKTVNILLVGQSDNRHVLQTLAKKYEHKENVTMNLYVCESLLENVARDLLFLFLALEEDTGLADKTKIFMEIYGNTLIRPSTSNYLSSTAQLLLYMVTDADYAQTIMPGVSFDKLKYKERDHLEIIFKYWASKDDSFDILTSWDERMRKSLGARYDAKDGVFDWDYHMRYRSFGADTLNMQEYKRFREKGMSFYSDDTDPCISNRTLASAIISAGSKIINYGYLGDIVTGPFPVFGFDCEDQKMLEKVNGYPKKTATDITENNVLRMFHEIANEDQFVVSHSQDEPIAILTEDNSNKLQVKAFPTEDATLRKVQHNPKDKNCKLKIIDRCRIIFLSTTALKDYLNKCEYENFFDVVTFPQVLVLKYFTPDLVKLIKPNGKVIVDTPKYILSYRKDDLEKYKIDLEKLMKECNLKSLNSSFSYKSDEFMRFLVEK